MRRGYLTYVMVALSVLATRLQAQVVITSPKEGTVSSSSNQAVTGQAPPKLPIRLDINGVPVDSSIVRIDGVFEFLGVPTPRGPVKYTVTARMSNGRTFAAEREIHVLGDPDSIFVDTPSKVIAADGQSVLKISAVVVDKWKVRIPAGYFVTVDVDSLAIIEPDVDPNTPGHQFRLEHGDISFSLRASAYVGPVNLTLTTNSITTRIRLYSETPKVPLQIVGSADATGKYLRTEGSTASLAPSEDFAGGMHGQGRLAATARGTVFDKYLLTLSVDTDRKLKDRIFRDLDPNTLYSIYGDNSTVTYEAQSTSPLFVKLEQNRSYALYGDFNTSVTRNEFSAYNRSFTGGRLHLEEAKYNLDFFGTVTNRKVVQEEIRGQGISGYYYFKQNNVVTGSEKVRIEVRDRFHSEIVISRRDNARYSDYEIDYVQGSLYFKQPVPSLDGLHNPVFIVVSYEAISENPDNIVAGGTTEVQLFNALTLGGTTVVEQRDPKNYVLTGSNALLKMGSWGSLQGEVARSSDVNTKGGAWKVEAEITPLRPLSLKPYYRKIDGTFVNPTQSGSGREVGTTKYGGVLHYQAASGTTFHGEYYKQSQSLGTFATDIRSLSGAAQQSLWSSGTIAMKIEDVKYEGENPEAPAQNLNTHSTLLNTRLNATLTRELNATAEYERNLRTAEKDVRPDAIGLGLEYQLSTSVSGYLQQKFLKSQGQLTTVGINSKVTDQTSVYGRYEIGNAISGERNAATIGLKNTLKLTEEVTANLLYEKTKNLGKNLVEARTDDHDALSASFEYFPSFPLRTTLKGEYSEDKNNIRKGLDVGATYRIANDLSILGKGTYYLSASRLQAGDTKQSHLLFGIAYRPAASNWLNLIAKVERKVQDNQVVQPMEYYRAMIATAHLYVEPFPAAEMGVKYALKDARERYGPDVFSTLSDFLLLRPQYDITPRVNVAGEVRFLRQRGANDLKTGYSTELGVVLIPNTMLSVGYNFQGYKDRDLVAYIYSVRGPFVTMRIKFTEQTFGLQMEE